MPIVLVSSNSLPFGLKRRALSRGLADPERSGCAWQPVPVWRVLVSGAWAPLAAPILRIAAPMPPRPEDGGNQLTGSPWVERLI